MVVSFDNVGLVFVFERQSESQSDALDSGKLAVESSVSFRVSGNLIEENRRRFALAAFGQHLRNRAHFPIPVSAVHFLKLAQFIDLLQPVP